MVREGEGGGSCRRMTQVKFRSSHKNQVLKPVLNALVLADWGLSASISLGNNKRSFAVSLQRLSTAGRGSSKLLHVCGRFSPYEYTSLEASFSSFPMSLSNQSSDHLAELFLSGWLQGKRQFSPKLSHLPGLLLGDISPIRGEGGSCSGKRLGL